MHDEVGREILLASARRSRISQLALLQKHIVDQYKIQVVEERVGNFGQQLQPLLTVFEEIGEVLAYAIEPDAFIAEGLNYSAAIDSSGAHDVERDNSGARSRSRLADEASLWSAVLDRGVTKCTEDAVDAGLIARALRFEPFQDILIEPQRNRCLGGRGLEPATHYASDDMTNIRLWMIVGDVGRGFV
jgi:Asp-tRNA(Asn)/Glu-tRNA(Gln) amidotransferase C subunit